MSSPKRIVPENCLGAIVDVQEFFLEQAVRRNRTKIEENIKNFGRLLSYFKIPILITLEKPIGQKGALPNQIKEQCDNKEMLEKNFFDLTREKRIREWLDRSKRKQAIVVGCETDVCVLQSCLGLLGLGYQVFVVEDLVFSSTRDVEAAMARMQSEGAVFLTYKTLYYELIEAVEGGRHTREMLKKLGPFPDDLPDVAAR